MRIIACLAPCKATVLPSTHPHIFPINHHIIAIGLHTSSAHWHFQLCHHCHITEIKSLLGYKKAEVSGWHLRGPYPVSQGAAGAGMLAGGAPCD
ncbi:hypothetical protein DPEC_G00287280 [Dallia pectoralis]|uniref:Uncharacterized protein n=1 Tax=Dallia pectoralis TaxID=75939 RepID=A0ACC2FK88_DALPE|nr:hypothetical protein DPEC_G00287280 [Dallia pectoralis]